MSAQKTDRQKGAFVGLAVGDAMGAPVEFMPRGSFDPVEGYRAGGRFRLRAGEWTDDTAMALALAESLVGEGEEKAENQDTPHLPTGRGFDPIDQLERYLRWWEQGENTCRDKSIGIGMTTQRTLIRFRRTRQPFTDIRHERFSGNGSLMRLAPVVIYFADDIERAVIHAGLSSMTTHASPIAVDACRYFAYQLVCLFDGMDRETFFSDEQMERTRAFFDDAPLHPALDPILSGEYHTLHCDQIRSSGYVIDTLKAALWSVYHTESFDSAILHAVNLGDDADTVGAVTGQLAGALYGYSAIPTPWIEGVCKNEMIIETADRLIRTAGVEKIDRLLSEYL